MIRAGSPGIAKRAKHVAQWTHEQRPWGNTADVPGPAGPHATFLASASARVTSFVTVSTG